MLLNGNSMQLQQYLPFTVLKLTREYTTLASTIFTCCNSTYRLRYWNFIFNFSDFAEFIFKLQQYLPFTVLKHITTLLPLQEVRVATVLTVYGIETVTKIVRLLSLSSSLQQYLPFTVLKPWEGNGYFECRICKVAAVLTVYGIETILTRSILVTSLRVATVLTVYGIETLE